MELALSGRIAEDERIKERAAVDFTELARLAAGIGYRALCIRPSHAATDTPDERLRELRAILDRHGLVASLVMPDAHVARQGASPHANASLRAIGPALHLARVLGAGLVRVALKGEDDIPWARRAADEACEHGIRLVHHTHTATPFETIAGCREMLGRIGRPNFGLTVEPANLLLCGQDYGRDALGPLGPCIFNVDVQNLRVTPDGPQAITTNRGPVRYERLVVGDPGGVDLPRFFEALRSLGYAGFVTAHQPAMAGITTYDLAQRVYRALAPLIG